MGVRKFLVLLSTVVHKVSVNFTEISRNRGSVRCLQCDFVQRQNNMLIHGIHQNDPTIMSDSPRPVTLLSVLVFQGEGVLQYCKRYFRGTEGGGIRIL